MTGDCLGSDRLKPGNGRPADASRLTVLASSNIAQALTALQGEQLESASPGQRGAG